MLVQAEVVEQDICQVEMEVLVMLMELEEEAVLLPLPMELGCILLLVEEGALNIILLPRGLQVQVVEQVVVQAPLLILVVEVARELQEVVAILVVLAGQEVLFKRGPMVILVLMATEEVHLLE